MNGEINDLEYRKLVSKMKLGKIQVHFNPMNGDEKLFNIFNKFLDDVAAAAFVKTADIPLTKIDLTRRCRFFLYDPERCYFYSSERPLLICKDSIYKFLDLFNS